MGGSDNAKKCLAYMRQSMTIAAIVSAMEIAAAPSASLMAARLSELDLDDLDATARRAFERAQVVAGFARRLDTREFGQHSAPGTNRPIQLDWIGRA